MPSVQAKKLARPIPSAVSQTRTPDDVKEKVVFTSVAEGGVNVPKTTLVEPKGFPTATDVSARRSLAPLSANRVAC